MISKALDTIRSIAKDAGWYDPGTGLGRRGQNTRYVPPCYLLTDQELADLYEYEWLARKIVRLPIEDAWQDSIELDEKSAERWNDLDRYEGSDDGAFLTSAHWGRLYGLALLLLGFENSGDLEQPLPSSPGELSWLEPIPGHAIHVGSRDVSDDPDDPRNYRNPTHYQIIGEHRFHNQRIHASRVIPFYGPSDAGYQTGTRLKATRGSRHLAKGTLSALDPCFAIMQEYGMSWNAVSHLLQEASVPIWKLKGLINGLSAGDPDGAIRARFQLQQEAMSVHRAVLLDAGGSEEYRREAASIADVPAIIQALTFRLSSAANIPVGRLFGRIIGGLGDTGDSDRTMWIDTVQAYRTRSLQPRLWRVMNHAGIEKWEWKPLGTPTETEQVGIEKTKAETLKTYFDIIDIPEQQLADQVAEALGIEKWKVEKKEPPQPPAFAQPVPAVPPVPPEVENAPED